MSSKRKLVIFGSILVCFIFLVGIYWLIPKVSIELEGGKNITLSVGTEYHDLGAKAYLVSPFKKEKIELRTQGTVDYKKLGKYIITYEATFNGKTTFEQRTIKVVDEEKPTINVTNKITACRNNNSINIYAKVIDNYDGDISDRLTYKIDGDKINLSASDSTGNTTEAVENIYYIDEEKPTINLNGDATINLSLGDEYIERGASAYDSCDGDLTKDIVINDNINLFNEGTYEVKYIVKDKNGNETTTVRKVIVSNSDISKVKNGIIYLTFDDGPGQYTEKLLQILDNYGIKATFFVTNQFPRYQNLIKKEYEMGHTVGIHTYSHKWSIYNSVEDYLDDFAKISEIVYNQTGAYTKYFRFPGGSSNTVSIKHSKGIITKLAKIMTERGYIYFDWTFDSADTSRSNNSKENIIKTVKANLKGNGNYIILMHDIKKNTLDALPDIIEYAKGKGYIFKVIDDNTPVRHFRIAN